MEVFIIELQIYGEKQSNKILEGFDAIENLKFNKKQTMIINLFIKYWHQNLNFLHIFQCNVIFF